MTKNEIDFLPHLFTWIFFQWEKNERKKELKSI